MPLVESREGVFCHAGPLGVITWKSLKQGFLEDPPFELNKTDERNVKKKEVVGTVFIRSTHTVSSIYYIIDNVIDLLHTYIVYIML